MGHCINCINCNNPHAIIKSYCEYCVSVKCSHNKCTGLGVYNGLCERHSTRRAPNLKKCNDCHQLYSSYMGQCIHKKINTYHIYTLHEADEINLDALN